MLTAQEIRIAVSVACVMAFAGYGFGLFGSAEAHRPVAEANAAPMPTSRDLVYFDGRLEKVSRSGKYAETCGRGQASGNTEVHIAMQFPQTGTVASSDAPGVARAHVDAGDNPKALILDSQNPTLWTVTGEPAAIILTGAATVAEFPAGVPVFAPRFVEECSDAGWIYTPRGWAPPTGQTPVQAWIGEDIKGAYTSRATTIANGAFRRDFTSWSVKSGDAPFVF